MILIRPSSPRSCRPAGKAAAGLRFVKAVLWAGVVWSAFSAAAAHPLAPSLLELNEQGDQVRVLWKISLLNPQAADLHPLLPPPCRIVSVGWQGAPAAERVDNTGLMRRWTYDCGVQGIQGLRISVEGLERTDISVLLRAVLRDGRTARAILQPGSPSFLIPERPGWLDVMGDYLVLGIKHILRGWDHLLFVLGLLLLVRERRPLLLTVTAFTLGHSVTLSLAVLGVVAIPSTAAELAIAASIWVLALELTRDRQRPSWVGRRPWRMASLFGLLHGLGFAAALSEAGLPQDDIPLALVSFNAGIEVGQIAFISAVMILAAAARALLHYGPGRAILPSPRLPAAYLIGALASYWCLQRGAALFL